MTTQADVVAALAPFARAVAELDLNQPEAARAALEAAFPHAGLGAVYGLLAAGREAGFLVPKEATPTLRFGRLAKPSAELAGMSVDVVDMAGAGAPHTHPNGEVSLCFAEAGDPRFCGWPEGWVVVPPGSRHTPEVTDGRMLIVYFLPDGAMVWG